jgi:hypothetical protein
MTTADQPSPPAPPDPGPEAEDSSVLFQELDALLERMLALPVNYLEGQEQAGDEPGPPAEGVPLITIAEAMPEPFAVPEPLAPSAAEVEGLFSQTVFGLQPSAPPLEPPPPTTPPSPAVLNRILEAPPPVPLRAQPNPPAPFPEREGGAGTLVPPPSPLRGGGQGGGVIQPPPALWVRPLLWLDHGFQTCMAPLGPVGRWLRGTAGRALLGWTGVLLLAAACGLAARDWFGWTW